MQYAGGILLVPGWTGITPYIVPWHNGSESHYPPHSGKLVGEADQVFVYEVQKIVDNNPTGKCITVTVTGNSSTTIHGLIPGTYTVTQKNNWSWRYGDADAVQTVSLPAGDTDVTFINSVANDSWNVTLDNGKIKHAPQIRKVICCATRLHTNKICMSVC